MQRCGCAQMKLIPHIKDAIQIGTVCIFIIIRAFIVPVTVECICSCILALVHFTLKLYSLTLDAESPHVVNVANWPQDQ